MRLAVAAHLARTVPVIACRHQLHEANHEQLRLSCAAHGSRNTDINMTSASHDKRSADFHTSSAGPLQACSRSRAWCRWHLSMHHESFLITSFQ